jgi:hypothetical protein
MASGGPEADKVRQEATQEVAEEPAETPEMLAERYKQQLYLSRQEVLRWKNRHDRKADLLQSQVESNETLTRRVELPDAEITSLLAQLATGKWSG